MEKETQGREGEPLLACDLGAMDSGQWGRYRELRRLLGEDAMEARELEDGYAFRYSPGAEILLALAEYVSLERLCCPFFDFAIEVGRGGGWVWLRITGSEGAKSVLEAAMVQPEAAGDGPGAVVGT